MKREADTTRRPGSEAFFLSGEFHYFRVERREWASRLSLVKEAGLGAVSIYVPWNWHVLSRGEVDFTGKTLDERDLLGVLETIAAVGLECVFRPGPFITAEWRNGGIPDWLIEGHPHVVARSATDEPATGGGYPALTYAHPLFRELVAEWLNAVLASVSDFLVARGGPIVNIQLDDEPSYFQKLVDPMAVDYNPLLIAPSEQSGMSRWGSWLDDRYGGLEAINEAHATSHDSHHDLLPPRVAMSAPEQLPLYLDWLQFKIHQVNDFAAFLHEVVADAAPQVPHSMLYPYLQPLLAGEFARYARETGMEIQLTNECYLALNAPNGSGEQKLGAVVACHEAYNMWRDADQGPPVTMELQASNASYLSPDAMEMLYGVTVARGIRGINFFMMVGGTNPPGYENDTGACYDLWAPIALDGSTRSHFPVISKLAETVTTAWPELSQAGPLYDTWLGCWSGYEASAMAGAAFVYDAWGHQVLANMGDMGLTDANSLPALMSLSSVSFGCLDLARGAEDIIGQGCKQLWVPCLEFMPRSMQSALVDYAASGGHLVLLPTVPSVDEGARPCTVLWDALFGTTRDPERKLAGYSGAWDAFSVVNGASGESLVLPGAVSELEPPSDAEVVATIARGGRPCAFTRPHGAGRITILGFRLQYSPGSGLSQHDFVVSLVESTCGTRHASTSSLPLAAMQCSGPAGGLVCVVDPVELGGSAKVTWSNPAKLSERLTMPVAMPGLSMSSRGARLLPISWSFGSGVVLRHATWELVGRRPGKDAVELEFAVARGDGIGEIAFDGLVGEPSIAGGRITEVQSFGSGSRAWVIAADSPRVTLSAGL